MKYEVRFLLNMHNLSLSYNVHECVNVHDLRIFVVLTGFFFFYLIFVRLILIKLISNNQIIILSPIAVTPSYRVSPFSCSVYT